MKVVHIMLGCFYIDNHSYQENMLPKYHKAMGHKVEIIASTLSFDDKGNACNVEPKSYINENGIPVIRLPYKKTLVPKYRTKVGKFFRVYDGFETALERSKPDIVFVHGCQFCDISILVKYLKTHSITVYVDNHADFSNSARNWMSKKILHGILWKRCAQKIAPYTKKFYGVLPARVDFLKSIYGLPENKIELLVMGADDEMVKRVTTKENRYYFRKKYSIHDSDFLIVTGGKIDHAKRQVLSLLKVLKDYPQVNLRVLVFGSVVDDMRQELMTYVDGRKIQFIGWLNNEQTARCIAASDLAVYPGRHSVLWEETVGLGIPMVVKQWEGTTHIDVGGNVVFIENDADISKTLADLLNNMDQYEKMKYIAKSKGMRTFSYEAIARRSIEN